MIGQVGLCDSFDEQDIQSLEAYLQDEPGPTLKNFLLLQEQQPITGFFSADEVKNILYSEGKDVKLVGNDEDSQFRAFFYILLLIGMEEKRFYPHLNTLIRQQFYKPNIFLNDDIAQKNNDQSLAMLEKCLQYFEEVGEGEKIEEYILRQPLFERACLIMLKNSVQPTESASILQQLSRKFNIDMRTMVSNSEGSCFQLGINKNYHILREGDYYFLLLAQNKEDLSHSKLDVQSIRSGQSGLHIIAPQASDQSTPKFKNSEVKYRKKSHKNSFGGDLEIVQYRDLLHLQSQKLSHNNAKVLSEFFDVNDVESCAENLQDKIIKKHSFQDIIDSQKIEMKGSTTIEPNQLPHLQRRNRKISSSQIIECRDFNIITKKEESGQKYHEPLEEQEEDDPTHKPQSYNSLVVVKEQNNVMHNIAKMRTSLIQQKQLQRIDERQSSQRQSTHPDHQSDPSEQKGELGDNESQVKLKDRKYSYFTQQMASTKSKKSNQIQSSNYVFRIPKNVHKNSEIINADEHEIIRKRFQENPLRFSQLGGALSENSVGDSFIKPNKSPTNQSIRLSSSVYSYQIRFQPSSWYKKQIIYHMDDGHKQVQVFQRSFALPIQQQRDDNFKKQSFGSANTLLSNPTMKASNVLSGRQPSSSHFNPFEINQASFLKNRIQSLANLEVFEPQHEDNRSMIAECRSLKNMLSPASSNAPKISFNYTQNRSISHLSPPRIQPPPQANNTFAQLPPVKNNLILPPPQPLAQPLQFRSSHPQDRQPLSPQGFRPQTFNNFLSGPGQHPQIRFVRR